MNKGIKMKNKNVFLLSFMMAGLLSCAHVMADQITKTTLVKPLALESLKLVQNYNFKTSRATILIPKTTQASTENEDDGDPTGPTNELSPTYLADRFEAHSPRYIRNDFSSHIPFSDEIFRDHTSLNTYYFYPAGYLLKHDSTDGFDINFLHRTKTDDSQEELIVLTFTLLPRQLSGGMSLLSELAKYAIKPGNNKPVDLHRLPISSVKVSLAGLSSLIPEENVVIVNSPQKVGDAIRVQATMTQSQKEDVVASIRSGGLAGDIVFSTNNGSFELIVPYFVSFTDFSGSWFSDIRELSSVDSIKNLSPYPLLMSGVVVYAKSRTGNKLNRYQIPLAQPVVIESGAMAKADKSFSQLVSSYGEVVSAWATFERIICDECINDIERDILVSPAQASRTGLPIEAIPNIFDQFSLFKVLVEVKSNLFSPNNDYTEVKTFTLRSDSTQATTTLYVNRDDGDTEAKFQYRIKPYHSEGLNLAFTDWKEDQGVMDITVTAGDIRSVMPEEE